MRVAGYSARSLSDKLGIRRGTRLIALGAPPEYRSLLGSLPPDTSLSSRLPRRAEFIHGFVRSRRELGANLPRLARALADDGALWISWPKKSSGVTTDLNENVIRDQGLELGLVDIKVCAVNELWSGLKFVRRLANRRKGS
jgi:hypothetical protein